MSLRLWDPFAEMMSMRQMMDRLKKKMGQEEAGEHGLRLIETEEHKPKPASAPVPAAAPMGGAPPF